MRVGILVACALVAGCDLAERAKQLAHGADASAPPAVEAGAVSAPAPSITPSGAAPHASSSAAPRPTAPHVVASTSATVAPPAVDPPKPPTVPTGPVPRPSVALVTPVADESAEKWKLAFDVELGNLARDNATTLNFLLTETVVFERSLTDENPPIKTEIKPVTGASTLIVRAPFIIEDLVTGERRTFRRVPVELTRRSGYEAGKYTVTLKLLDGTTIGGPMSVTLQGQNPPIDRRAIVFKPTKKDASAP